jgi:hypothetical protein
MLDRTAFALITILLLKSTESGLLTVVFSVMPEVLSRASICFLEWIPA